MASLASLLPKPKAAPAPSRWDADSDDDDDSDRLRKAKAAAKAAKKAGGGSGAPARKVPPYGQRAGFMPVTLEDFGDGGAFPEIPKVQYPLDMGRQRGAGAGTGTGSSAASAALLPLQTDESGQIRYDLVLHEGQKQNDKKIIHSSLQAMRAKDIVAGDASFERPDQEAVQETTDKTRLALEKLVGTKMGAKNPKNIQTKTNEPVFVRYTPADQGSSVSGAQSRIIKMVEAPIDPMEPSMFKHKKTPRGPPSPPPPVMHSPPRKVSAEEQRNWVIPPCISNWKNAKGYTIPLDKRLANDGRGLTQVTINDNFAKLSEALFIADRHARDEVKLRAEMQGKLAAKEKREKEEKLRMLAQKAREERAGLVSGTGEAPSVDAFIANALAGGSDDEDGDDGRPAAASGGARRGGDQDDEDDEEMSEEQKQQMRERDRMRREKAMQRERELRMSHMGTETRARVLAQSTERDISEKIALGLAQPTVSKESLFDQRLFNQSEGLSSGFGAEDSYGIYDKPLFQGTAGNAIYRPKRVEAEVTAGVHTEKIERLVGDRAPHRGFQGADGSGSSRDAAVRDGPVAFEKEADLFGFQDFMSSAKRGREGDEGDANKKSKR